MFTYISIYSFTKPTWMYACGERECSKPAEKHQTLITNCVQERLALAQYTKHDKNIIFGKASLFTFLMFNILSVFLASSCILVQRKKYMQWGDFQFFFSERKCNQEVTCWLTFDLLPQRAIRGYFLPFTFHIWSKKLKFSTLSSVFL